jgi:ligand-binding SRPBCC domain-containing protein
MKYFFLSFFYINELCKEYHLIKIIHTDPKPQVLIVNSRIELHLYMPLIELKTIVNTAPEVCFDLSLDIDLHMQSMKHTNEKAISGITNGQIKLGETVTWKATHFGLIFSLTSRITELVRPLHFTDEMIKGPFKQLRHQHIFEKTPEGTVMTDLFDFRSPLGILGIAVDKLILEKYLRKLLAKRNDLIKQTAERQLNIRL